MKIIVAESAPLIRHTIVNALMSERVYEIVELRRGRDVLARIDGIAPDAVIIGSEVEGMDGVVLAMHIRAQRAYRVTPLVLISGPRSYGHVLQAVQCGVDDYIVTPFSGDVLLNKLAHAIRRRGSAKSSGAPRILLPEFFLNP